MTNGARTHDLGFRVVPYASRRGGSSPLPHGTRPSGRSAWTRLARIRRTCIGRTHRSAPMLLVATAGLGRWPARRAQRSRVLRVPRASRACALLRGPPARVGRGREKGKPASPRARAARQLSSLICLSAPHHSPPPRPNSALPAPTLTYAGLPRWLRYLPLLQAGDDDCRWA